MKQAIQALKAQSVPFTSQTAALRRVKDLSEKFSKSQFETEISMLAGKPVAATTFGQAKYTYLYLVTGIVDVQAKKVDTTIDALLDVSETKAADFIKKNPWLSIFDPEAPVVADSNGTGLHQSFATKKPKGKKRVGGQSKLDLARASYERNSALKGKALLEIVAKEVGTSTKGANSLVYLVRKELKTKK